MIFQFIHRFLKRRHFWRHATFSEIAELYASRMMRIFALRMVSVFTSIYLLQLDYSLVFIALFWAGFYFMKTVYSWPAALLIAKLGPKHATLISNIVSAVAMVFLPFAANPEYAFYALVGWCALHAYSSSMNDMAYMVDFSKVKSVEHAGKELGFMNIIEKVATGLSPFIGGAIAFMFGPQSIMIISAFLFLMSALPLLATAEPTKTHVRLRFKSFPWRTTWRSMVAEGAVGVDIFVTGIAWSIFLAIAVFGITGDSNRIYAEIGFVTSVTLFVAIFASYGFGRIIDHRRGGELLRMSAIVNSGVHALRVFVTTPFGAVATNIINEASTAGYNMPFLRGVFDTADYSGRRIEYLFLIEVTMNLGAALAAVILALLVTTLPAVDGMKAFFIAGALLTLLIATPRFVLYKK